MSFDDAYNKYQAASDMLGRYNYAEAIFLAQQSIELSIKALLTKLNIEFKRKHDIGDEPFTEASKLLKSVIKDKHKLNYYLKTLAKARILMKLLADLRTYAEYGFIEIPAKDIFDVDFKPFAEWAIQKVFELHFRLKEIAKSI